MNGKPLLTFVLVILMAAVSAAQSKYETDFAEFWNIFEANYAYRDESGIDLAKARLAYQTDAAKVTSEIEFIRLLEIAINEFHNGHISLNTNLDDSNRIIPSGSDVFAEFVNGVAVIRGVKPGSRAERAGLKAGMRVVRFNGNPIPEQIKRFYPRTAARISPAMNEYAINMLFAGTHDRPRSFSIASGGGKEADILPDKSTESEEKKALLDSQILKGNIGLIRINNSLFNSDLIGEFDAALDRLSRTRALIIDLTDTPSGGNTLIARAIMGRFIDREMPYQKHEDPVDFRKFGVRRSWFEMVSPRGKVYRKPLIVMVGHWTGSMGEGLAIGFDGLKRAEVVGTRMAGLLGAIEIFNLPATGIGFSVPTEKLYHIDGRPRESFVPRVRTSDSTETLNRALRLARTGK